MSAREQRLVHFAAWTAMLDENDNPAEMAIKDAEELKRRVKDTDEAWRLANALKAAGVDPALFPGLETK